ncbi:hypothetical protein ACJX0J_034942, partial [Zea mays]
MIQPGRPYDELGRRLTSDYPVYDGRGSDAALVARMQGITVLVGNAHQLFTIVFETGRFKGSTLLTNGMVTEGSDEWAVYGGTGAFAMATGVIRRKNLLAGGGDSGGNSDELSVEVFCPVFGSPQQPPKDDDDGSAVTKIGLWGGPGGSAQDITTTEAPRRLNSVTIRAGIAVDSIEFTYTGKDRQRRTAGRWGGLGGNVRT